MYDVDVDQGWGEYSDERDELGGGMGSMGGLAYTPNLAPSGNGPAYYPGSIGDDADALGYLGFLKTAVPETMGNAQADMAQGTGAWNVDFREALAAFQTVAKQRYGYAGKIDGWVGPMTRNSLGIAVLEKNASESPVNPPFVPPVVPPAPGVPPFVPPSPAVVPPPLVVPPAVKPASTSGDDNTTLYIAGGVGALALLGLAWWALD
jgi:hypothetical protein